MERISLYERRRQLIAVLYKRQNDTVGIACYVPMSGGERQIRQFSSAFILMYSVSFIIYMTV